MKDERVDGEMENEMDDESDDGTGLTQIGDLDQA